VSDDIITKQDGAILRITLNRPERGNAMSDDMVRELTGIIRAVPADSKMILLRGAGDEFCVGRAMMGQRPTSSPEAFDLREMSDIVFDCYSAFRQAPLPVVGVVQGSARGFGCAIAAACDITLASDKAIFQVPEMLHQIMPTMVLSSFVDRVPRKAMSYMVYSTNEVTAERAVTFGIASEVFPAAELDAAVDRLCATVLNVPPPAIRGVKDFVRFAPDMPTPSAVDYARNIHSITNASSRMREKKH
jgi:enoyl-CoA hydratase